MRWIVGKGCPCSSFEKVIVVLLCAFGMSDSSFQEKNIPYGYFLPSNSVGRDLDPSAAPITSFSSRSAKCTLQLHSVIFNGQ